VADSTSVLVTQIERIVEPSFRRTRYAKFQLPTGYYLCNAWFEDGEPRMQIRSSIDRLEDAAIVATAIHMAIDWLVEETARGGNTPASSASPGEESPEVFDARA
jgi:hypothetical protein